MENHNCKSYSDVIHYVLMNMYNLERREDSNHHFYYMLDLNQFSNDKEMDKNVGNSYFTFLPRNQGCYNVMYDSIAKMVFNKHYPDKNYESILTKLSPPVENIRYTNFLMHHKEEIFNRVNMNFLLKKLLNGAKGVEREKVAESYMHSIGYKTRLTTSEENRQGFDLIFEKENIASQVKTIYRYDISLIEEKLTIIIPNSDINMKQDKDTSQYDLFYFIIDKDKNYTMFSKKDIESCVTNNRNVRIVLKQNSQIFTKKYVLDINESVRFNDPNVFMNYFINQCQSLSGNQ